MSDEQIIKLMIEKNKVEQVSLYQQGIITAEIVDKMYKLKFEQLEKEVFDIIKVGFLSFFEDPMLTEYLIAEELVPSANNKCANYWYNVSIKMQEDALKLIMEYIAASISWNAMVPFEDLIEPEKKCYDFINSSFDSNYIPSDILFSGDDNSILSKMLLGSTEVASLHEGKLIDFIYLNLDKLNDCHKGLIKTIKSLNNFVNKEQMAFLFNQLVELIHKHTKRLDELFNSNGPTTELYDLGLFNYTLFNIVFMDDAWKKHYNVPNSIKQYIMFTKVTKIDLTNLIKNKNDIFNNFDENGCKDSFLIEIIKRSELNDPLFVSSDKGKNLKQFENLYNSFFISTKRKIPQSWNEFYNSEFIRKNYMLLLKLITRLDYQTEKDSINKDIPYTIEFFRSFEVDQLIDIYKYCLLNSDKSFQNLTMIIHHNNLSGLLKVYNFLFDEWNIDFFKSILSNYMSNLEFSQSVISYIDCIKSFETTNTIIEPNIFKENKEKIKRILVAGDKNAIGVIKNVVDLNNYSELISERNNMLIQDSNNIFIIREAICNLMFNLDSEILNNIYIKYIASGLTLKNICRNINNPQNLQIMENYDLILGLIISIGKERNINHLKKYLQIINDQYKSNELVFLDLWKNFSQINLNLNRILGMEINEKITDFNELLDFYKQGHIPVDSEGNQLFNVTNKKINRDFEYDGKKFKAGTNIPFIELTGLPFVTFGHVLNAYGSGGKVSDFNNPRIIGRTHLCLSAIDDNYYNLVNRPVSDIDHVQLLFSDLPDDQLVIASDRDVASRSENNSRNITSRLSGNYNPVRENISNTYHGANGYNEYVYYRDNIKPSAVLIKGDEPNEAELQAAVYLQVPLVKINKQYYPRRTEEEMKRKDRELQDFYTEMYKRRTHKNFTTVKLKLVYEQLGALISIYDDMDTSLGGKVK